MLPRRRDLEDAVETPRVPTSEETSLAKLHEEPMTVVARAGTSETADAEEEPLWETRTRVAGPAPALLRALQGTKFENIDDELAYIAGLAERANSESHVRCIEAAPTTGELEEEDDNDPTLLFEPPPRPPQAPTFPAPAPSHPVELLSEHDISALSAAFRVHPSARAFEAAAPPVAQEAPRRRPAPTLRLPVVAPTNPAPAPAVIHPPLVHPETPPVRSSGWGRLFGFALLLLLIAGGAFGIAHWHIVRNLLQ
jgi:hypothetical protein